MPLFLGLDTSNYTTSCALYDSASGEVFSCKELLPVREGERGLRQSDAVFHHTRQLPDLMEKLFSMAEERYEKYDKITAVAYSYAPREVPGSYMPCFLVGENTARSISAAMGVPVFRTSHQKGHILAALYSCEELGMLEGEREFLAFHVSGGTTDLLLCRPGGDGLFQISEIGRSSDLKAGQCIDRIGVRLGLGFPCGAELERLALCCDKEFKIRPSMKGLDCSFSGIENQCVDMIERGCPPEETARYCLMSIYEAVNAMTAAALKKYGDMPVIYAGGVMADRLIRDRLEKGYVSRFAEPALSSDNAVGVAVYAARSFDNGSRTI